MEEQTATTPEMTRNGTDAAGSSDQISVNTAGMTQATQTTSRGAQQARHAADELSRMSDDLTALITTFTR